MTEKSKTHFMEGTSIDDKQHAYVHRLHAETDDIYADGALDPVYQAKARVLNDAIQEIGMGKYQVRVHISIDISCID